MDPQTGEIVGQSSDVQRVYAALVHAQACAPEALGKVDYNSFAKFDYVSADRMIMAGRRALATARLALLPLSQQLDPGVGEAVATLRTVYRLAHESGQYLDLVFSSPVCTKKGTPEDKAAFGASTESLGYVYRGLLSIGRLDPDEVRDVGGRDDRDYEPRRSSDDATAFPPPPDSDTRASDRDDGADQLVDEFIDRIRELEKKGASLETLRELEQIPPQIKKLSLPASPRQRLVNVYNEAVLDMREKLQIPA